MTVRPSTSTAPAGAAPLQSDTPLITPSSTTTANAPVRVRSAPAVQRRCVPERQRAGTGHRRRYPEREPGVPPRARVRRPVPPRGLRGDGEGVGRGARVRRLPRTHPRRSVGGVVPRRDRRARRRDAQRRALALRSLARARVSRGASSAFANAATARSISGSGPTATRTCPGRPTFEPARTSTPCSASRRVRADVVDVDAREHEADLGRKRLGARPSRRPSTRSRASLGHLSSPALAAASTARSDAPPAARATQFRLNGSSTNGEAAHHRRVGDRVAEPQPGQPVQLREAAQEDHGAARPRRRARARAATPGDRKSPYASSTTATQPSGSSSRNDCPLGRRQRRGRRIVRVADPGDPSACLARRRRERPRSSAYARIGERRTIGPAGGRDERVEVEADLRDHDAVPGPEQDARDGSDERLQAVTRRDLLGSTPL